MDPITFKQAKKYTDEQIKRVDNNEAAEFAYEQGTFAKSEADKVQPKLAEVEGVLSSANQTIESMEQATLEANQSAGYATEQGDNAKNQASLVEGKLEEADQAILTANQSADNADEKAGIAQQKADLVDQKVSEVDEALGGIEGAVTSAEQSAGYASAQGDYAKEQGDIAGARLEELEQVDAVQFHNRQEEFSEVLAQTETRTNETANATQVLEIVNPYGNIQNIHPKVLYFENAWNGFKWWMAYTPYPGGNVAYENPCIAVSNDGLIWAVPEGLENPLADYPGQGIGYYNDTNLVYRSDVNTLECWWRFADTANNRSVLKRRTTTNGVDWTPVEDLLIAGFDTNDHLSPSVIFEDGKYKMWSITRTSGNRTNLRYLESADGKTWTTPTIVDMDYDTVLPWHLDVIKTASGYEFLVQSFESRGNNFSSLYYFYSADLVNYTKPQKILKPSDSINAWDNQGIYRSSIVKVDNGYLVYYSAISRNNRRAIAISYGETPFSLKGMSTNDQTLFRLMNDDFYRFRGNGRDIAKIETETLKLIDPGVAAVRLGVKERNTLSVISDSGTNALGSLDTRFMYLEKNGGGSMLKAGGLKYTDSASETRDGDTIVFYDGSNWRQLAEKYIRELSYVLRGGSSRVDLVNGSESLVTFRSRVKDFPQQWTSETTYTASSSGWFDIDINFVLNNVPADGKVRAYLKVNGSEARQFYENNGNGGVQTVNSRVFLELQSGNTLTVAVVFTGSGSPSIESSKGFLRIEKKYNTIY